MSIGKCFPFFFICTNYPTVYYLQRAFGRLFFSIRIALIYQVLVRWYRETDLKLPIRKANA
jgi:hypothetical protein